GRGLVVADAGAEGERVAVVPLAAEGVEPAVLPLEGFVAHRRAARAVDVDGRQRAPTGQLRIGDQAGGVAEVPAHAQGVDRRDVQGGPDGAVVVGVDVHAA